MKTYKLLSVIFIIALSMIIMGYAVNQKNELVAYPYKVVDVKQFDDVDGLVFFGYNEEYNEEVIFLDDQIKGIIPVIGDEILAYFDFDSHCIELIYITKK